MREFLIAIVLLSSCASAYETVVTKQRELQAPKYTFNLYFFTCGKEVYKCGRGAIDPQYLCPTPAGTVPAAKPATSKECLALTEEARKDQAISLLYGKASVVDLCPNGKNVVSYVKYTTEGAGRYCKPRKACMCCQNGEVGGDPHFLTYDGTPYSYHGQCDLVMAQSEQFANGTGLRVHARTEIIEGTWSVISNAAVKIVFNIVKTRGLIVLIFGNGFRSC
jgi:von Willebrand factor type D domain